MAMLLLIIFLTLILNGPIIILSEKRSIDSKKFNKLDECQRCKVLTDSFNIWLDKTSRGKHEGGDAAWEETNLKSYARSEMRLVEIQESLCSDVKTHQDDCYALAEEAEQVLEKWWFRENYDYLDLYTWLCIENLKYCCPPNHFGEMCTACQHDENNKICGGNGECNGEGTRKGNGTCICKRGYSGKNCDVCSINFYNSSNICKPCYRSCNECYGNGPNACVKCAAGWTMETDVCVDINECLVASICKASDYCTNSEGSYSCHSCENVCKTCSGPGPTNCTSCYGDNVLWVGKCMTKDNHSDHLKEANIRAAIYLSLLWLFLYRYLLMFRQSRLLGKVVIALIISLLLYYFGKKSEILFDLIYNH